MLGTKGAAPPTLKSSYLITFIFTLALDKRPFMGYIIVMIGSHMNKNKNRIKNDLHSFEVWILISIVLFIATLAFGFYIESV